MSSYEQIGRTNVVGDIRYGQFGHTNIACRIDDSLVPYLSDGRESEIEAEAGDLAFLRETSEDETRARVAHTAQVTVDFLGVCETARIVAAGMNGYRGLASFFTLFGIVLTAAKTVTLTVSGACSVMNSGRKPIVCGQRLYYLFPTVHTYKYIAGKMGEAARRKAILVNEDDFGEWIAESVEFQDIAGNATPHVILRQVYATHFVGLALTNATSGSFVHVLLKD